MTIRLPLSFLGFLCTAIPLSRAGDWVRLSLTGPNGLSDQNSPFYYANNVLFGTPPASESLVLDLASYILAVSSEDCVFCPGSNLFNPNLSSTFKTSNQPWPSSSQELGGVLAQDTVSFGGVLTDQDAPFELIQRMSQNFSQRILDGHLGLYVSPTNETSRQQNILTRLQKAGQLLNPVVGLALGNTPDTSHITIGALDPNDYEGTINWVQAETPDPSWDSPLVIQMDGFRGFNGSFLPYQNPLFAYINSLDLNIRVPDANTYMADDNYTGPVNKTLVQDFGDYGFMCNGTGRAYVHLAVDINGVSYQIDSQNNLLRNHSIFSASGACTVGLHNFTTSASIPVSLGVPFLRSVYLAYRFPTDDCPNAYYGFAFQKGANRTSEMIAQQPRSTPSSSAHCLSLVAPTSTPAVTTPPPQVSANQFLSLGSYNVWQSSGQVRLKGVDQLSGGAVLDSNMHN